MKMTMNKYAASETETYIFQSNAYTCVSYAPIKREVCMYESICVCLVIISLLPTPDQRYMYLSWTTVLWQMCEDHACIAYLCNKHHLVTVECAEALCCPTQLTPTAIHIHLNSSLKEVPLVW